MILKVILYIKFAKYGVSKTQAPQPPALKENGNYRDYSVHIGRLYRDNGKENGNYGNGVL